MTRARDLANLIGSGNYSSTTFTATAGQTAFTIAHTQGFVQVFMNGLLLDETVDYTSDGSAVTLTSGAAAGDEIEVVAYNTFSVGDALNQAAADTRYVNASGDTMTGDLNVGSGGIHVTSPDGVQGLIIDQDQTSSTVSGRLILKNANDAAAVYYSDTLGWTFHTGTVLGSTTGTQRAYLTPEGYLKTPYQPAFNVNSDGGGGSSGFTIIGSTAQNLSVTTNIGSHFATSTGRFTAPVAGTYLFSGYANFSTSSGGPAIRFIKNGSTDISQNNYGYSVAYNGTAVTCIATLAVNDYVYLECNHYNNVTSTIWTSGVCGFLIG